MLGRILAATAAMAPCLCGQTLAQLRDEVSEAASSGRYSLFVASIGSLVRDGEMSGGRFTVDSEPQLRVTDVTLPYRRDFLREDDGPWLRVEASLGYATVDTRFADLWSGSFAGFETEVDTRYEAFVFDGGIGPTLPLGRGVTLSPLLHGGASWLRNEAEFRGPGAAFTQAITEGILFDWEGTYASIGGSLALRGDPIAWIGASWSPQLRYDVRRTEGIEVDDPALDADDTTQWMTARLDVTGPLDYEVAGASLSWLSGFGYRRWLGTSADQLQFDDIYEATVGVSAGGEDALPLVEAVRFSVSLLFGDDVQGWSVGFGVTF
jgi:hypothetical protein